MADLMLGVSGLRGPPCTDKGSPKKKASKVSATRSSSLNSGSSLGSLSGETGAVLVASLTSADRAVSEERSSANPADPASATAPYESTDATRRSGSASPGPKHTVHHSPVVGVLGSPLMPQLLLSGLNLGTRSTPLPRGGRKFSTASLRDFKFATELHASVVVNAASSVLPHNRRSRRGESPAGIGHATVAGDVATESDETALGAVTSGEVR